MEAEEEFQDITQEHKWWIQGLLFVEHSLFKNYFGTLIQEHDTRKQHF